MCLKEPEDDLGAGGSAVVVALTASDKPGAELAEPLDKHPVAALRWWLLCRGIKVSEEERFD